MRKLFIRNFALLLAAGTVLSASTTARAVTQEIEPWSKPAFVYGSGLSEADIEKTAEHLDIKLDDTHSMGVNGTDIAHYIDGSSSDAGMISSVVVTKLEEGKGVAVEIKTPDNITEITEIQYAGAAITAGVDDVQIDVAAVRPVTGESALTGVYKALDANGVELDKDRMVVAQDELEAVNEITKENEGKDDFERKNFDTLIINIKNELNIYYNSLPEDKQITRADIERIINEAIEKNDLKGVLSQANIDRLTSLFEKYAKTDAINSDEVVDQLKELSGNIIDRAKDLYEDAEASGLIDRILNFFKDLFQGIVDFFRNL